jgi:protein ImuB
MQRRFLCLFFPRLTVDRLECEEPQLGATPFAVVWEEKGHLYVVAANDPARGAGIRPGMRLADARTLLPALHVVIGDLVADARWMQRLVVWCDRYSPLASQDGADGIVLDVTGCAHLFGGEAALLDAIQSRIGAMRLRVRAVIAGTHGAAWALARFSQQAIASSDELPTALECLPIKALRIPDEIAVELGRVGLATIGQLRRVARDSLSTRYGPNVLLRLDQALGHAEEPITPYRAPAPHRVGRVFAEPIGSTAAVEHVLLDLLTTLCARLEKEHCGARRFDLDCHRVDSSVARLQVRTSKAGRSITHLMRLFSEKMGSLDAGFGIEIMTLSAADVDAIAPQQLALPHYGVEVEDDTALNELLDRMGLRLGFEHVCRIQICESLLPERAAAYVPVTGATAPSVAWPAHRTRPVRLIEPPSPIEVAEIIPGKLPTRIRIGRELHRVVRAEGPERLTPEWWHEQPVRWSVRDYYRIEDEHGMRLWIFRETLRNQTGERWFLHGQLP